MVMNSLRACDAHHGVKSARRWTPSRMASLRQAIDSAVAAVFEVDLRHLEGTTRGSTRTAFARQVAMYLAHVVCGLSLTQVGRLFASRPDHGIACLPPRRGSPRRSRGRPKA
jgi:hypothetical protein